MDVKWPTEIFFFLVLNGRLIQYDYSPKGAFQESQDSVWHSYQGWRISIIPLECTIWFMHFLLEGQSKSKKSPYKLVYSWNARNDWEQALTQTGSQEPGFPAWAAGTQHRMTLATSCEVSISWKVEG